MIAPEAAGFGRLGFDVALGLAGFAVTRIVLGSPPEPGGGLEAASRIGLSAVPALVVVWVGVLTAAVVLLPPADLVHQARTALWTALGNSGGELLKQGPWDPAMSEDLLLHGWALGAAAQLAFGWSGALVLLRRLRLAHWIGAAAVCGVLASVAVGVWMRARGAEPHAFYLSPPRAWAFLLGAMLALRRWPAPPEGLARAVETLARLGPVALPFWLWTGPLLTLPRMILARPLQPAEIAAALAGAVVLAIATTVWIERPLRRRLVARPVAALATCGAMLAGVALASVALLAVQGLPDRASAAVLAEEASARVRPPLQAACEVEKPILPPASTCTVPAGQPADVVLWGNSHGSHLSPALLAWAGARGHAVRQATMSGCLPLSGRGSGLVSADCARFNQLAIAEWGRVRPDLIVVGAGWTVVLARTPGEDQAELEVLDRNLRLTLALLRAAVGPETRIVLVGNTPDHDFAPGGCHARRAFLGLDTGRCDRAIPANAALAARVDARLEQIAATTPGVFLFRPSTALCDGPVCRTRGPDGVWYSDQNHLTEAGGRAQTAALSAVLDHALATR